MSLIVSITQLPPAGVALFVGFNVVQTKYILIRSSWNAPNGGQTARESMPNEIQCNTCDGGQLAERSLLHQKKRVKRKFGILKYIKWLLLHSGNCGLISCIQPICVIVNADEWTLNYIYIYIIYIYIYLWVNPDEWTLNYIMIIITFW